MTAPVFSQPPVPIRKENPVLLKSLDPFVTVTQEMIHSLQSIEHAPLVRQILQSGFFYLEIPKECSHLLEHAKSFANHFYKDDALKQQQLGGWNGYHDRDNLQIESFYCENKLWKEVYPEEVAQLAEHMQRSAMQIMKQVAHSIKAPKEACDYLLENELVAHFSFNHYRPERAFSGLTEHRDIGFITALYIDKPGLEVRVDGDWIPLPPKEGYFVINFARMFEALFNTPDTICAAWHRVMHLDEERTSFGLFLGPAPHVPACQLDDGKLKAIFSSTKEFEAFCFKEVYTS